MASKSSIPPFDPRLEKALRSQVRGEVSLDPVRLGVYATDASVYRMMPLAVVEPRDAADVRAAVEIARAHGATILPRGAGTSLAGQTVNRSIVLDFSRHMNRVLEFNPAERWVRVEPGVILDPLNEMLAAHGLQFAPDPATSSRATLGGMIGNNSAGTKSILYGMTKDHLIELTVLLADGSVVTCGETDPRDAWLRPDDRAAQLTCGLKEIVDRERDEISLRFPKVMRRVQGYNLDEFLGERWNMAKLIAGSEGTLGIVLEAKLHLEPLPKCKALCVPHYADLLEAIRSVETILAHGPSCCEIMDEDVLVRARRNLSVAPLTGFIEGQPKALLVVEFYGDTPAEVRGKAEALAADLQQAGRGYAWPVLTDATGMGNVWGVRKNGLGLMLGMKGGRKPLPFIEDAAVPVKVLPEYVAAVLDFCRARGVGVAMYAHASVGLIHIRPILDLKLREDIEHMKAIANHAFGLVKGYGGSWCGEHGDGRVRSPFLERYFGPRVYQALRDVKALFDPDGLLNPGMITGAGPMDGALRFGEAYKAEPIRSEFHFREDLSFGDAVEMCTGVGACRQRMAGTMCPSYRATLDEEHATRGRANALRLAMSGQFGPEGLASPRVHETLDLCLSCKACKSECPSNVDMARLKSEFLQHYHDAHGVPLRDRLIGDSPTLARRASGWTAPIINKLQGSLVFRRLLERAAGFDMRRTAPAYARRSFTRWFEDEHRPAKGSRGQVVLFEDTYLNFYEPHVGISAVELLESCGYEVLLARAGCCQRPRISHGLLRQAKSAGGETLRKLDVWVRRGLPVVVCEPSCASALTDDLPDLIDDAELGERIKAGVMMIDVFLAREIDAGRLPAQFTGLFPRLMIHGHCHQKALYGTRAMKKVLAAAPGTEAGEVDSGCCGMAGSFGYEREHYDLSIKIGEDRLMPAIRQRDLKTTVVACGFSCRHQIADITGVRAVHWVETVRGKDLA